MEFGKLMHAYRFVVIALVFMLFFSISSCWSPYPDYKISDSGIYFKFHKIGETQQQAKFSDYVTVNLSYKTITDSVFFSAKRRFQVMDPEYRGSVDECFTMLSVGDSASFILKAKPFFENTLNRRLPSFMDSNSRFIVDIELLDFISEPQFIKEKAEFLAWIEDFALYEKTKLSNYLTECTNDYQMDRQGLYKQIISEGHGATVKNMDTLVLHYEGRFLNGKVFDSTLKRRKTFEYIYGIEWQVIKGMELAVSDMKEGEKAMFILPSEFAFGQTGNSNGAIPPFSTLIYEIELLQIRR